MNTYEVSKECWINGTRYLATQLVKLTEAQAKEWLDRKCIKLNKETIQAQSRRQRQTEQNKTENIQDKQVAIKNNNLETKEEAVTIKDTKK